MSRLCTGGLIASWLLIASTLSHAHVSEQGFVLLLPTGVYISSGVAAVALTVILLAFVRAEHSVRLFRPARWFDTTASNDLPLVSSTVSFVIVLMLLWVGVNGSRDPLANPLPLTIWTVFWIAFVVLQGVCGDLWRWVNPWMGVHTLLCRALSIWTRHQKQGAYAIPEPIGQWPAVMLFMLLTLFTLAYIAPDDPFRLAVVVLAYLVFTFAAMWLFGARVWLSQGECFSVLLRYYALLAPVRVVRGGIHAGMPGWSALESAHRVRISGAVFILVLLGCGSFDGLNETFWWLALIDINPLAFPGRSAVTTETVTGLLAAVLLLILLFGLCVAAGLYLAQGPLLADRKANTNKQADEPVAFVIAFSRLSVGILPIAFAYHFAHFLTAFLVNGQYALAALNDPMNTGADLLGLGNFYVTTGFFNTHHTVEIIWLTQAGAVVLGHLLSVMLTHAIAVELFASSRRAVLSQIPMAVFMILYTWLGLWLLASPRGA